MGVEPACSATVRGRALMDLQTKTPPTREGFAFSLRGKLLRGRGRGNGWRFHGSGWLNASAFTGACSLRCVNRFLYRPSLSKPVVNSPSRKSKLFPKDADGN